MAKSSQFFMGIEQYHIFKPLFEKSDESYKGKTATLLSHGLYWYHFCKLAGYEENKDDINKLINFCFHNLELALKIEKLNEQVKKIKAAILEHLSTNGNAETIIASGCPADLLSNLRQPAAELATIAESKAKDDLLKTISEVTQEWVSAKADEIVKRKKRMEEKEQHLKKYTTIIITKAHFLDDSLQAYVLGGASIPPNFLSLLSLDDKSEYVGGLTANIEQNCWKMVFLLHKHGVRTTWSNGYGYGAKGVWFENKDTHYFIDIITGKIYPAIVCDYEGRTPQILQAKLIEHPEVKPLSPEMLGLDQKILDLARSDIKLMVTDTGNATQLTEEASKQIRCLEQLIADKYSADNHDELLANQYKKVLADYMLKTKDLILESSPRDGIKIDGFTLIKLGSSLCQITKDSFRIVWSPSHGISAFDGSERVTNNESIIRGLKPFVDFINNTRSTAPSSGAGPKPR